LRSDYKDENIEFEDEMRIGTRTDLGRKWSPRGVRPTGRQKIGYQYLYLYVTVKPFTGEMFACFLPRLDKECFNLFVEQRSKELSEKTLMIVDGAGAHRLSENRQQLELSKLPPYSPELNPVERLFQELRRRLKFRVFETLDEAENYVSQALQEFFKNAEQVKSLTLYPYIKYAQSNLN